jgi:hypothetical protein
MNADTRAETEYARSILEGLIRQRRAINREGKDNGLLEANGLGILYWQQRLARSAQVNSAPDQINPARARRA